MLATLVGKTGMHKIALPQTAIGNYWISDTTGKENKKLLNIEGIDGNWKIVSNNSVKIIDLKAIELYGNEIKVVNGKENIEKEVILREHDMHGIYFVNSRELFILYCLPVYEDDFLHLDIKHTQEIRIGNGTQNHISYNNKLVSSYHARIFSNNGRLLIENFDTGYGTFVNNIPIGQGQHNLFNGDIIFIMGLKIIIMGNSIFINNPRNTVKIKEENLKICKERKDIQILQDTESEDDLDLYSDDEYYSRAPRITNIIETEKVKIDAPPKIQEKQEMPLILVLGSTISMGAMMMVSMINTIDGSMSGTADSKSTIFSLIMTVIMLIGMLLFPILTVKYEKKQKIKYEEKRQKRYREYLNSKKSEISKIKNKQRSILFENYVSSEECVNIILNRNSRLWERKIEDHDFLAVRLGIGDMPLKIEVQYPEEQFAMEDDELVDILNDIGKNSKILNSAPIVTSLAEKNVASFVVQDEENFEKFMQNVMLQLATFHSYEDLKLVFLLDKDKSKKWEYVKMLPHLWNSGHQIRFFANNYDEMQEISQYLEEELQNRVVSQGENYKSFMPYYLIITDNYKKIENLKIITEMLKIKDNLGFSLLCITNDLTQLPNECNTFVSIDNKKAMIFENEISSTNHREIALEVSNTFFFGKIWQTIANIPVRYTATGKMALPSNYSFLEMFDVGLIEQLNVLERWKKHDSTLSLRTPIGIDSTGMPIVLDIHEKFHGPHGLIAGSTGSGKSEFIITYILSLALNYHPDDVTFLLIDYKGGGLAGAFEKRDMKLPHLVGTITNIDTNGLQRSLASIHSEVKRRQIMFNEARNKIDEGTIDIYKYQKLYHEGVVDEPISHLLIICDEFAELKQQQEDFMDELISISRIGRSLGVHLILATQKPAGIVNEQIRSNSKFAVCLKVQGVEDSMDVIRKPDAAKLKSAGQFYMQVGNDDYFVLGQSAWAGATYFPSETIKKKVDTSVEFISNTGMPIKRLDDSTQQKASNEGEQLTNIVKYIHNLAKQEQVRTKSLWLENVPATIYIEDIENKYRINREENNVNAVIGEYDDPYNQKQGPVNLDISSGSNVVVYGNAESGKETLLSTMTYNLMTSYTTEQLQMYLLDFGSEALKIFKKAPHVGDVIFMGENEKISRFFDMLQREISERKAILSDYNGDYQLYLSTSNNSMPMIVVIMNNYEAFNENYENDYDDLLLTLTREGSKCGITFVITASSFNDIRYRMAQNFKQKVALQLNKEDDYYNIFEEVGKKRPAHIFGRGLYYLDKNIYEFQTAKICEDSQYNNYIKETIETLSKTNTTAAKPVPILPDKVTLKDVKKKLKGITSIPLGITEKDLNILAYNLKKAFVNIVTAKNMEDAVDFAKSLLDEINEIDDVKVTVLNAEKSLGNTTENFVNNYKEFASEIEENMQDDEKEDNLCVIIGIDRFLNNVEEFEFKEMLEMAEESGNYSFIIVESANRMKEREYDSWYKEYISGDTGIWVGDGFDSQYLINITADRREIKDNCGRSFGYLAKQGQFTMIKLLGMKEDLEDE